jgi:hypothetical protein
LADLYPNVLDLWSLKNINSPYEYLPFSTQKVWWKCPDGIHEDFLRDIHNSTQYNFHCSCCNFSKGEKLIEKYLINININYVPQYKRFDLLGVHNGYLSYDFYLPNYNLLIEYQGLQHYEPVDFYGNGIKEAEKAFKIQIEHDKRKRQYAKIHNIKLLEISYMDYQNIYTILDKELQMVGN